MIMMQRLVKVDGKARTDSTFPAGFMGNSSKIQKNILKFQRCHLHRKDQRNFQTPLRHQGKIRRPKNHPC
jgi:hypothetical protein